MREPLVILVMGVSGCGKSTVGAKLAGALSAKFVDADDYHSEASRMQMASGIPLTDNERLPWLQNLNALLKEWQAEGQSIVLACSALRKSYRAILRDGVGHFVTVYLQGSESILQERMDQRSGHFMPSVLLKSQLATLEEPSNAVVVDISQPPGEMVAQILSDPAISNAIG